MAAHWLDRHRWQRRQSIYVALLESAVPRTHTYTRFGLSFAHFKPLLQELLKHEIVVAVLRLSFIRLKRSTFAVLLFVHIHFAIVSLFHCSFLIQLLGHLSANQPAGLISSCQQQMRDRRPVKVGYLPIDRNPLAYLIVGREQTANVFG
ncbi:Photosystem II D2 protein [Trichinella pseudospiralis]